MGTNCESIIHTLTVGIIIALLIPGSTTAENVEEYDRAYTDPENDVIDDETEEVVEGHPELDIIYLETDDDGEGIIAGKMVLKDSPTSDGSCVYRLELRAQRDDGTTPHVFCWYYGTTDENTIQYDKPEERPYWDSGNVSADGNVITWRIDQEYMEDIEDFDIYGQAWFDESYLEEEDADGGDGMEGDGVDGGNGSDGEGTVVISNGSSESGDEPLLLVDKCGNPDEWGEGVEGSQLVEVGYEYDAGASDDGTGDDGDGEDGDDGEDGSEEDEYKKEDEDGSTPGFGIIAILVTVSCVAVIGHSRRRKTQ